LLIECFTVNTWFTAGKSFAFGKTFLKDECLAPAKPIRFRKPDRFKLLQTSEVYLRSALSNFGSGSQINLIAAENPKVRNEPRL
ncbi:hypothetical protein, partial [Pedobacter miscanthi]